MNVRKTKEEKRHAQQDAMLFFSLLDLFMHEPAGFLLLMPLMLGHAVSGDIRHPVKGSIECPVWLSELSFAKSVDDRDVAAFARHLHPNAVFGLSLPEPTHGAEAIKAEWTPLIQDNATRLRWYPTHVNHAKGTRLATSSGPVLTERQDTSVNRWLISRYSTVWELGKDRVWRVLFDDGTAPRVATDDDIKKFHAERKPACQ